MILEVIIGDPLAGPRQVGDPLWRPYATLEENDVIELIIIRRGQQGEKKKKTRNSANWT
jgi:hypothetical protein